jgi:hypothetical protein
MRLFLATHQCRCPDDMYALMRRCWEYEAHRRPTFQDICAIISGTKSTLDLLGMYSMSKAARRL